MPTLIHDPAVRKLGKLEPKPPRLRIANYIDLEAAWPQVPDTVDNSHGQSIELAMYLNDRYGDCTCAAIGNTLRVNSGGRKQLTDANIEQAYVAVTGQEGAAFDPSTGANDNGCVELDVLDYWTKTGVGGDKLLGHAGVTMTDPKEVKVIAYLCGAVYLGVALATAQQNQDEWDFVAGPAGDPGSWGGHAVPLFDVAADGAVTVGTWGSYKKASAAFVAKQADEGHALITQEWLDANKTNPLINAQALAADLAKLDRES